MKLVIVTMSANGLKYILKNKSGFFGEWQYVRTKPVTRIVDSSGAGDWLSAAFIHQLIQEYPRYTQNIDPDCIRICFEKATEVAALSCGYVGAQGALFSEDATRSTGRLIGEEVKIPKTKKPDWRFECELCKT